MKTLFSPVGTADPITQQGDGPMLHIVRHYQPERVVLFLSPLMQRCQSRDARYTKAIELLCESEGLDMPTIELVESPTEDVHRFDHYIEEFEQILERLCEQSPEQPVLLNATSGTPAMQQSLITLSSFGQLPLLSLQVATPRKSANKKDDREDPDAYDLDFMWQWNEGLRRDNPASCESRISEVASPNFAARLDREHVEVLVRNYEYEAAYELASTSRGIDGDVKLMLRAAADRLNLDGTLPAKVFGGTQLAYRPNDLLSEFLAVMEVRLAQGQWADFLRLLTPALTQVCKNVLRDNGIPEQAYLRYNTRQHRYYLDWDAIDGDARLRTAFEAGSAKRSGGLTNWLLVEAVREICGNASTAEKIVKLRTVEESCRNPLAHEVRKSRKEDLERIGGLPLETVMRYLFDLHPSARPGLYADISHAILERL